MQGQLRRMTNPSPDCYGVVTAMKNNVSHRKEGIGGPAFAPKSEIVKHSTAEYRHPGPGAHNVAPPKYNGVIASCKGAFQPPMSGSRLVKDKVRIPGPGAHDPKLLPSKRADCKSCFANEANRKLVHSFHTKKSLYVFVSNNYDCEFC